MPFSADLHAKNAKPRAKPYRMSFGNGLLLDVRPSGSKAWLLRFMVNGKRREMGLGAYPAVSLADAREKALQAKALQSDKLDPLAVRDAARRAREEEARRAEMERAARIAAERAEDERRSRTFRMVAEALLTNQRSGWSSDKTTASWRLTLDKWAYPKVGDVPIADFGKDDVTSALEGVWTAKPATARKLQRRIAAVLDFAAAKGWRAADNPAAGRVLRLTRALPAVVRKSRKQASLPWHLAPAFLAALDAQEGASPLALRFTVLTALRSNEVRQARWNEMDWEAGLWVVPGAKMKGGKAKELPPHRVPLTAAMRDVLARALALRTGNVPSADELPAQARLLGDQLVFPNGRGDALSDAALGACIKRMNGDAKDAPPWRDVDGRPVTAHGMRRSFRTWVDDEHPHEAPAAEKQLGHEDGNTVAAAYKGSDLLARRRILMERWGDYCTKQGAEVVPLRRPA